MIIKFKMAIYIYIYHTNNLMIITWHRGLGHGNVLPKFKKLWEVIGVLGSMLGDVGGTRKNVRTPRSMLGDPKK